MGEKEEQKDGNVLQRDSMSIGGLNLHYTQYRTFDPEQMTKETKIHKVGDKDKYISFIETSGVRAVLTITEENAETLTYNVSLSGPEGEVRDSIIKRFQELFGNGVETFGWKSTSYQGVTSRDMYVWTAIKI